MSGAWSKGTNKAVSSAPPPGAMQNPQGGRGFGGGGRGGGRNNSGRRPRNHSSNSFGGDGGGRGGGRGRGRGGGRNNYQNNRNNNNNNNNRNGQRRNNSNAGGNNNNNDFRITHKDVQLLNESGLGDTAAQRKVVRINAREFIRQRLQYVDAASGFEPNPQCHWIDENRIAEIKALCSKVMELGDVSKGNNANKNKSKHDTAPALEDCKPLEVNEEKRWKSKAMTRKSSLIDVTLPPPETTEEIVNKARLILNKVSWTTLEKLSVKFMETTNLEENEEVRKAIIDMLVHKAQIEPHFGPMYAQLCAVIGKQVKPFKKELLSQCQKEFEIDTAHKIENATKGITDAEEIEYHSTIIRKAYIGHMKFLGELYLRDVVKLSIMMYCLDELLKDDEHEESLECFCSLMTTMGEKLDGHANQNNKAFDWQQVQDLRNSTKIANRIKFLLQDLLDLRQRGWVKRRQEDTAKTIADIHKEVAKEEEKAKMARRVSSTSNLRRSSSLASATPPQVDDDGFVSVSRSSFKRVNSKNNMNNMGGKKGPPKPAGMRRAQSQPVMGGGASFSPLDGRKVAKRFSNVNIPDVPILEAKESGGSGSGDSVPPLAPEKESKPVVSPDECAKKIKNILKEYFVGGDTDDAALSVEELVQVGVDGSVDRGAKIIEGATLLVMEMKAEEVKKMLTVMTQCVQGGKVEAASIAMGLNDPLEFLSDIEIDAPLAGQHLATIVAECVKLNALKLEFLKDAPEYFRTDGKPAAFAVKVLKARGGDPSEEELQVVDALMTDDDHKAFESGKAMFEG